VVHHDQREFPFAIALTRSATHQKLLLVVAQTVGLILCENTPPEDS
jgi:hypothetical protein